MMTLPVAPTEPLIWTPSRLLPERMLRSAALVPPTVLLLEFIQTPATFAFAAVPAALVPGSAG